MDNHTPVEPENLEIILKADEETREWVYKNYERE